MHSPGKVEKGDKRANPVGLISPNWERETQHRDTYEKDASTAKHPHTGPSIAPF